MIAFFMIFAVAIIMVLAVQAMDVECARTRPIRRRAILARGTRTPFRVSFRNMLGGEAR